MSGLVKSLATLANTESETRRHLRVTVDDTVLDCRDSNNDGRAIIFLNGAFGSQKDWKSVVRNLDETHRAITFDQRGRGKSKKSENYSFETGVADLRAIVEATGVERPILVGWSLGATVAVHYTAEFSNDVAGLVLVDGAYPISTFTEEDKQEVRRTFRRWSMLLPLLARFGKAAKMSASKHAEVNIELDEINGKLENMYDRIQQPISFISATKRGRNGTEEQFQRMRSSLQPLVENHPNIKLFDDVPCTHSDILSKHPDTIVDAIDDLNDR